MKRRLLIGAAMSGALALTSCETLEGTFPSLTEDASAETEATTTSSEPAEPTVEFILTKVFPPEDKIVGQIHAGNGWNQQTHDNQKIDQV
ncbi:MAG: hypothetical protein AAF583_09370, partial [Pseudomonadota bacterium]